MLETRVEAQQARVVKLEAVVTESKVASAQEVATLTAELAAAKALNKALEAKLADGETPLEKSMRENVELTKELVDCKCENEALVEGDLFAATYIHGANLAASSAAVARSVATNRVLRSRQVEVAAAAAAVNRARARHLIPTASSSALGSYYKIRAEREGRLRALERARRGGMRY